MDKIQEQWPEWQAEELLGKGTFGEVRPQERDAAGLRDCALKQTDRSLPFPAQNG